MEVRFSDGSTTYNLYTGSVSVLEYTPKVEDRNKLTVSDSLIIFIAAGSLAAQQTTKDTINGWLALAREQWETVNETRIYIEIRQASETDWRRSELLGGKLQPMAGTLDSHSQIKQQYQLVIERRNWWEWPEEELPLSIDNATFATGGATYSNDGAAVFMQGSDIAGDPQMPVPVRLELTAAEGVGRFYVGHNVFSSLDPLTDDHILEGEAALTVSSTSDANSRGGFYDAVSWGGAIDHSTRKRQFYISSALVNKFAGRWFRVFCRVAALPTTDVYVRVALYHSNDVSGEGKTLQTEETLVNASSNALVDLGAIRIPPQGFVGSVGSIELDVTFRAAGADGIGIDFLAFMPTDSFFRTESGGLDANLSDGVTMDGRLGLSYIVNGGKNYFDMSDYPPHISLWPGRDQWLCILHDHDSAGMDLAQNWTAKIYYRPRRVTV